MNNKSLHSFHIPVMGLAYTIDSPIRVAQYGISSVISIIDDEILEKMRAFYSSKFNLDFFSISTKEEDYRAKRVTAYLNMIQDIVGEKFEAFKQDISKNKESLRRFIDILPTTSEIKSSLQKFTVQKDHLTSVVKDFIDVHLTPGAIDVNIMTKVDKDNFNGNEQLPVYQNDAHSALRGFAQSELSSSVVFSAGLNPRLYGYLEEFDDFFPDSEGNLRKKIILKVSDFRSAMIQGNFLAKKGLWVSEYRIESGLNCGGHAFATEGQLLGPILEEFKQRKQELIQSAHSLMITVLQQKEKYTVPEKPFEMKITVQGGVGTSEEHEFLLTHYGVNSIGWGSPFLLVPEATTVDPETRRLLADAKEDNFYLSHISPLGVPFNTVNGTSNEMIKKQKMSNNRFGSSCPKKLLALSKEFSPKGICTASREYQENKLRELEVKKQELAVEAFEKMKTDITEKSCLCVGLVNSAYIEHGIQMKGEKQGVIVCPGPNLAFFDKEVSLSEMIRHIYGNANILPDDRRPNMFINELKMYVDYLIKEIENFSGKVTRSQFKKWSIFKDNLLEGIAYYNRLLQDGDWFKKDLKKIESQLKFYRAFLSVMKIPAVDE